MKIRTEWLTSNGIVMSSRTAEEVDMSISKGTLLHLFVLSEADQMTLKYGDRILQYRKIFD